MSATVMLVDDEPLVLDAQRRILRRRRPEWNVITASSGEDALAKLGANSIDVAVIDLMMPGIDGIELAARIHRHFPHLLAIMLTGNARLSSVMAAINEGNIFRFHTKPCSIDALLASIEDAIGLRARDVPSERLGDHEQERVVASAVAGLPLGIIVLDRRGRLLRMNGRAETLVKKGDCLFVDAGGVLRSRDQEAGRKFSAAISGAVANGRSCAVLLRHDGGGGTLAAAISALYLDDGSIAGASIALSDSDQPMEPNLHAMSTIFGLTPTEARLSRELAKGLSLEDASAALRITVSSARTYLKTVFQKTGAARQADLVRLILTSAATYLPEPI